MTFMESHFANDTFDAALDVIAPRKSDADSAADVAIAIAYVAATIARRP